MAEIKLSNLFSGLKRPSIPGALVLAMLCSFFTASSQINVTVFPDSAGTSIGKRLEMGVFYVPKTQNAQADFLGNGLSMNSIRTHILESALNNTTNLNDCISFLDTVAPILQQLSNKAEKLIFILEKMPPWLSSSNDAAPATTPGWAILNTKPPASYPQWNAVVAAIADRIYNTYGLSNAWIEVWNEPDLGSWTASSEAYFELFRNTHAAIKAAVPSAKVGGPAVNHWANHIYQTAPAGHVGTAQGDASLIAELIDSSLAWQMPLDFVSWHMFGVNDRVLANAEAYVQAKYAGLSLARPPLILSEWNVPSSQRDGPLQRGFMAKLQMGFLHSPTDANCIAAWQDFEALPNEFHNDYGMLSTGGIHKPAYKSILLCDKITGEELAFSADAAVDFLATKSGDTLQLLLANFAPPPFVEALNHTLFEGMFQLNALDSAGYIDLAGSNPNPLDSIYKGLAPIPNNDALQQAINNSIPVYAHYDSIFQRRQTYTFQVPNLTGTHAGTAIVIDSTRNNSIHRYDSLLGAGQTSAAAIALLTANQELDSFPLALQNGSLSIDLEPNAVCLLQFEIPGLVGLEASIPDPALVELYPNPTVERVEVRYQSPYWGIVKVYNGKGQLIQELEDVAFIDLSEAPAGVYTLLFEGLGICKQVVKVSR